MKSQQGGENIKFIPAFSTSRPNLSLSSLFGGNKQLKLAELIPGQFILLCQATMHVSMAPECYGVLCLFRGHFISYICAIYIFVPLFSPLIPKTEHADGGGVGVGEDKFKHNRITLKQKMQSHLFTEPSHLLLFPPSCQEVTSVNCDCLLLQSQIT